MTEKDENVIDVGNEEFIDSEEWKDNFLKQGKWIRLFWMLAFSFVYYLALPVKPNNKRRRMPASKKA